MIPRKKIMLIGKILMLFFVKVYLGILLSRLLIDCNKMRLRKNLKDNLQNGLLILKTTICSLL